MVTVLNDVTEREELLGKVRRCRDELEIQVRERTRELVKVNEELKREIEERGQAQQKLTEQAKILEAFFSSTITPLVFLDKDFNFVRVNEAYAKCCQRDIPEFQGHNHFEFYPQEENEAIFRKVVETKAPFQAFAKPFSFPDHPEWGVTYWDWALTPLLNSGGEVEFLVFALNDVSERKRAEEKHRLLATAVEQAAEGVLIIDRHFVVRYANPALLKITGYSSEDIVGRNSAVTRNDQRQAPFYKSLRDTIRRGEIWEGLYPVKRRDGTICQLNVNIAPARNESGAVTHYVIHCHDITQEMELEERLRQAQKMEALGTLAGGIAHDFNNLLNPIILNIELALWDIQEGTLPSSDSLKMVVEAAKRGQQLVKQILIFSRQKEQQKKPVEITPTLKEAMKFLRSTIPKSIEMREAFEAGPAMVLADSTQMYQVLMNLCSNAAHAMREKGGILEVTLTRVEIDRDMAVQVVDLKRGSYLRLTVRDTGQGMDREVRRKAFDPFFTTKKPGEGTGIGLAVVHGIVKNHEGAITLESEVGKGTTVSVFLPLIQGRQEGGSLPESCAS